MVRYGLQWKTEDVLRFVLMMNGEQCVLTSGALPMAGHQTQLLTLFVGS